MNQEILKKDEKMSDWWLGTVGLTFSPVVISVIIDLCAYGRVDFGGVDRRWRTYFICFLD